MLDAIALQQLIRGSLLLTQQEKEFWMQTLPRMRPDQQERLAGILARASKLKWTKAMENVVQRIAAVTRKFVASPSR